MNIMHVFDLTHVFLFVHYNYSPIILPMQANVLRFGHKNIDILPWESVVHCNVHFVECKKERIQLLPLVLIY